MNNIANNDVFPDNDLNLKSSNNNVANETDENSLEYKE